MGDNAHSHTETERDTERAKLRTSKLKAQKRRRSQAQSTKHAAHTERTRFRVLAHARTHTRKVGTNQLAGVGLESEGERAE